MSPSEIPGLRPASGVPWRLAAVALAGFVLLAVLAASSSPEPFDLVIRRARVVDGSGSAWFRADVGVKDGRIAAVGMLTDAPAARTIDAGDRVLSPGFIDVHMHVEGNLPARPDAANLVADGVTTVVTGNCGASELDLDAWFTALERDGIAVNVASLIGHNSVRSDVMGYADRPPTAAEQARMEWLVERAMGAGAAGLSSGLIYSPGTFARMEEVIALARVAGGHGGIYATHMRSENDGLFPAIDEALETARAAGIPLQISHYKVTARKLWGSSARMLALIEAARREGQDVTVDEYPYAASSSGLDVLLPERILQAEGSVRHALVRRLADPADRAAIAGDMRRRLGDELGRDHLDYGVVASAPWRPSIEGKNLRSLNREMGRTDALESEIETVLDLCREGAASGRGSVCGTQMVYHTMEESDVERIFAHPLTMVARDGGVATPGTGAPHPRSYGTCARVLSRFVRERGLVTLEEAVRKMTSLPAARFRFADRGLLKEGFRADLVLFDPDTVADLSRFEDPHHLSRGFDLVVVNGRIVREEGVATCERPGMVLRRKSYQRSAVSSQPVTRPESSPFPVTAVFFAATMQEALRSLR
ncbi:MAG: D-aminoacylase [Acidobacteria bacterium]|nr:D-aminoacylase [Acidobacteriota bacterium]MCA1610068.1 D-aminoacylase [Acidobacteriota bacterium]